MIRVELYRNANGNICGFKADDHGESYVCAAVTALVQCAVNSVEALSEERFTCDYDEEGGYLSFFLPDISEGKLNHDVDLLLKSFVIGLAAIVAEEPEQIVVID